MIGLIVAIIFAVIGAILIFTHREEVTRNHYYYGRSQGHDNIWYTGFVLALVSAVLLVFICILPTSIAYVNQIGDKNAVTQFEQNKVIYEKKAQTITTELKGYLAVQYPNFEKGVIDKIASNPHALFVLYPQLQSSRTIVSLTDTIVSLQSKIYEQ